MISSPHFFHKIKVHYSDIEEMLFNEELMKKRIAFVLSILISVVTVISLACTVNVQAKESIAQIVSDMPLEQKVA